mgnify:CR=1 FL=1
MSYLKLKITSVSQLVNLVAIFNEFMTKQAGAYTIGGSYVNILEYPFPLKIVTFLYRPLFIDANNAMMLAASCENIIYLGLSIFAVHRYSLSFLFKRKSLFYTVNLIFLIMFIFIFSLIIVNMGLANRMKIMIVPSLLSVIFISQSYYRGVIHKKKQ